MLRYLQPSSGLFYFYYGVSFALYLVVLFTSKKKKSAEWIKPYSSATPGSSNTNSTSNKEQNSVKKFYMNVFFMDRKEVIRNLIRTKVPRNRPVIRALAKRAAVVLLEKGIVERIASVLCDAIPDKLSKMGVSSQCNIVYSKAAYVCIEVTLSHLDLYKLLAFNSSPEKADRIMFLLDRFGLPALTDAVSRWMMGFLMNRLMVVFPANIKEKLFNRFAAELEIINCTEEEQGGFLLQTMNALESNADARPGASANTASSAGGAEAESAPVDSPPTSSGRSMSVGGAN